MLLNELTLLKCEKSIPSFITSFSELVGTSKILQYSSEKVQVWLILKNHGVYKYISLYNFGNYIFKSIDAGKAAVSLISFYFECYGETRNRNNIIPYSKGYL